MKLKITKYYIYVTSNKNIEKKSSLKYNKIV